MIKKGYTMLEMLVCLCILSVLMIMTLNKNTNIDLSIYEYMNEYLIKQSESILNNKGISFEKGVSFNNMGHVNQARTIDFEKHKVIVHLGSGYLTYE